MAESMKGLKRTARCAELTVNDIGREVTLMGWVAKSRNKGGIIFVDLRDRSGLIQIIFDGSRNDEATFEKAGRVRSPSPARWSAAAAPSTSRLRRARSR